MVFKTYSKRQKEISKDTQEIYTYNEIPGVLKVQIVHIWYYALGDEDDYFISVNESIRIAYKNLVEIIRKEIGVFISPPSAKHMRITFLEELVEYFLKEKETNKILDVIELSFQFIDKLVRDFHYQFKRNCKPNVDHFEDVLEMVFNTMCITSTCFFSFFKNEKNGDI